MSPAGPPPSAGGEGEGVMVSTSEPIAIRVSPVPDERTPEGSVCLGTFIGDRLVARQVVPPEAMRELTEHRIFDEPVRLSLLAFEEAPGVQCRLLAMVPPTRLPKPPAEEEEVEEPWKASVPPPPFEEGGGEDEGVEDEPLPVLLGHIVRLSRDRKHPGDLEREALDVLQTILDGKLSEVVDRVLEDLLEEGPPPSGEEPPPVN